MNDKEKIIKEQRTIEAARKNLMGLGGKLGCVLKMFGQPMIRHGSGADMFETTYLDDYYEIEENDPYNLHPGTSEEIMDQLPIMDDASTSTLGWHFDGLNVGMHLEIKYLSETNELTVSFKGHLVYKEIGGELEAYIPLPEWENNIESLYPLALKRGQVQKEKSKTVKVEESKRSKQSWLDKMSKKWGFNQKAR